MEILTVLFFVCIFPVACISALVLCPAQCPDCACDLERGDQWRFDPRRMHGWYRHEFSCPSCHRSFGASPP